MSEEIQINTQDLRDYIKNASLFSDTYFRAFLEPFKDYINGEFEDISTDIGKIVHDLKCVNPDEMLCDELRKPALYLKQTEGGFKEVEAIYKDNVQRIIDESKSEWIAQGLIAGKRAGIAEGLEVGEKNGLWKAAKNLLKLGLPLKQIAEATTLELAEIQAMALTMA